MIIFWMLFAFMIILLGLGIIFWRENEGLSTKEIVKKYSYKIAVFILIMSLYYSYMKLIPLNKNHGIAFNAEREKIGLRKIENDWNKELNQFNSIYWNEKELSNGHVEKIIEYGFFGIKSETDYYKNVKYKNKIISSKYNFNNNTIEYFICEKKKDSSEELYPQRRINKNEFKEFVKN